MAEITDLPSNIEAFRKLYRRVYKDREQSAHAELDTLYRSLFASGCKIENGWGHYLHTPDGKVIILDDWNEEANDKA